jgi:hypothetical protein
MVVVNGTYDAASIEETRTNDYHRETNENVLHPLALLAASLVQRRTALAEYSTDHA